ncbi:MAG TPA: preprotein translocase subunit SecG [Candidatus Pacearchaeota archaeon]|nr:preprotein translocase subunit SecG [Candidatus Pacearchaeota archaeon]HPR79661.1 preprotein translocase subunit SecG [Candidatus Pacearchaeota archaeon]
MNNNLLIAQSVVSILIVIAILLQQRGTALGSAFGGGGEVYSTRRGIQKNLLWATIVLTIAFLALTVLNLVY